MFALRLLAEGGEGPNAELLWLLYAGLAFFLLAILIGWWSGSRKQDQSEIKHEAVKSKKKEADDLARIEGIGPKVVKILKEANITTFEELAHAKATGVQKILDEAGLHMMDPEGWIAQARLAAKGDWQAFEKLQGELKGGRRK
jgi:hypothetical protein